ncbi:MAG: hypothetical protein RSB10_02970 [Clostridia bacterium]
MITIDNIDLNTALKYLGYPRDTAGSALSLVDCKTQELLQTCAEKLLRNTRFNSIYKILDVSQFDTTYGLVIGEDIKKHLQNCQKVAIIALTLGGGVDSLIRTLQVEDMAQAVVVDALASALSEQYLSEIIVDISAQYPSYFSTWGYSAGYGDYPLQLQGKILSLVDAQRKIGLVTDGQCALLPSKSITTIVGLSTEPLPRERQSCESCSLNATCKLRKNGDKCGH